MNRALGLAACLVACASAPEPVAPEPVRVLPDAPAGSTAPAPVDPWTALVAKTLAEVSQTRGLSVKHAVPCVRLGRPALLARVKAHVAREVPPEAVRSEGNVQKLLGFFPTNDDYEAATYALLETELAGYYEPRDGTMYLADDLEEADALDTLSHELVHALQDQHWDLGSRGAYVAGQSDRSDVVSALAEGDATITTEDLRLTRLGSGKTALDESDDEIADEMVRSMEAGPASRLPHALRSGILAPYIDGSRFVEALRRSAGGPGPDGWARVNEAWEHPPETTEQLLHLGKWEAREPALLVPDPAAPAGFSTMDVTTLGEQELRLAMAEWTDAATAQRVASGWGGDRVALFRNADGALALAWHVRFDEGPSGKPDALAERAFLALRPGLLRLGSVKEQTARAVCLERHGNGALRVFRDGRDGRDLWLVVGSVKPAPRGWAPAMRCAELRVWSDGLHPAP